MRKSFLERRFKTPDYQIEAWITGVRHGNTGLVDWDVRIEGEDDCELAASILEIAAEVLRDENGFGHCPYCRKARLKAAVPPQDSPAPDHKTDP